ncbi:GNAT family N-acetyltransferase [Dictyobacter aurantiacus]|uniref:N-acetyltransferase domain-containing protein n=1 Tax=Dictyobacter aurantiacus TaxID=1936993 RepID=A0A401Z9R9_9CHLR|nr:GNAT family N-acetyltransferase [Dictyobacter aurantiacus]GCE03621.1 hypothetical protein KDAU_09500 [Dictyobacter aurantiacus]
MIIRLHQLSARAPRLQDSAEVAHLLSLDEHAAIASEEQLEAELKERWQDCYFQMASDAWMIVTRQQQVIGYADVQRKHHEPLEPIYALKIAIHPEYQSRGIETLLIRLGEERIRYLSRDLVGCCQIHVTVDSSNSVLCEMMQHEGYCLQQQFLRMQFVLKHIADPLLSSEDGLLTLRVALNDEQSMATQAQGMDEAYRTSKYSVYVKTFGRRFQAEASVVLLPCTTG